MINIHIYPSAFKFESRMLKETKSIAKMDRGYSNVVISMWQEGLEELEVVGDYLTVHRVRTLANTNSRNKILKAINYAEFLVRVILKCASMRISIVNAHSLTVLPIAYGLRVLKNTKLIYDTHELETERESLGGISKKLMKRMERIFIYKCDRVICVNHSIADWYRTAYGISNVFVVRNIPYRAELKGKNDKFRETFGIPQESTIFLYQGILMPGRAIDFLLELFSKLNNSKHIVFMGYGDLENEIRQFSETHENIHFHQAVKMESLPLYTSSADVGVSFTEKPCLSYRYSLGNKFFEFINAETPFIFWDGFMEVTSLNQKYDLGWSVPAEKSELSELISRLTTNEIELKKQNIKLAKKDFDWTNEEIELKKAYDF